MPMLVAALLTVTVAACADQDRTEASAAHGHHRRATLAPTGTDPLRVRGTGFAPHERVKVTLTPSTGGGVTRRLRAGRHGRFLASFPSIDAAGGVGGVATGSAGSHASFQFSTGIGG